MKRLILGTAQFGMIYGLNNKKRISLKTIKLILNQARKNNVKFLDTASSYGNCEKILGKIGVSDFSIISKVMLKNIGMQNPKEWLTKSIKKTLNNLKVKKLYGLLIHNPIFLKKDKKKKFFKSLEALKDSGLIKKIGFSVYDPNNLDTLFKEYKFDIVQLPINIIDRRFAKSLCLKRLKEKNIEIHGRSVFLQGLLLNKSLRERKYFKKWKNLWNSYHEWTKSNSLNSLNACLNYVNSIPELTKIVIGVDSYSHLQEIMECKSRPKLIFPEYLQSNDINLVNPSKWENVKI